MKPFAGLPCLKCGNVDCVTLCLDDLETYQCRECEDEFTREDVKATVDVWTRVLAWVDAAK